MAVSSDKAELTFRDLNASANRIAHHLLAAGGRRGDRVCVLMDQELPSFAAMLAVLKAGRVLVMLNPGDPPARFEELLVDSEAAAIVTDAAHRELAGFVAGSRVAVFCVDDDLSGVPSTDPDETMVRDDLAILVYTSGTTGRPKGVIWTHGHLMGMLAADAGKMRLSASDRLILITSPWGGLGMGTVWWGFGAGAQLVSYPTNVHGVTGLAERMIRNRVTIYASAASLFRHFMKSVDDDVRFPDVRYVRVSSDAATSDDFDAFCRHFPNARFVSTGGMSEGGVLGWLELSHGDKVARGRLPVGKSHGGVIRRIVDDAGCDVAPGTIGTIVFRSPHRALGYWRDPELTARHFSITPDGMQEFRSSDLGWIDGDGNLVHAGRRDATYKIRGQRVDLAEVQRALGELPGIAEAAATAVTRADGELQLVGFVVAKPDAALTGQRLRARARAVIARHLIPTAFVFLDEMPRTANGKLDMVRLRTMSPPPRSDVAEHPVGDTETMLARIWEEAFHADEASRTDDFFELGGESLIAAVIAARVHAAIGIELHFGHFVEHPSLAGMAAFIDATRNAVREVDELPLKPADRSRPLPLSLQQRLFWRPDQAAHNSRRLNGASAERIDGKLDLDLLRESITATVARHEMLRTRFPVVDGEPVQLVEPSRPVELPLIDWSTHPDGEERVAALIESEADRVFDLASAPPVRLSLVKTAPEVHWLVTSVHHIILDHQSANLFIQDVAADYAARVAGDRSGLAPLPLQYGDVAVWQQQVWRKDGPRVRATLDWWRRQFEPGLAPTTIPLRRKPPGRPIQRDDWMMSWGLPPLASKQLDELGYSEGATFYMVRLAGLAAVLGRLSGRDDVVIGGIFTNRNRVAYERMFGCFVNLVTIVLGCPWQLSFRDFVRRVRDHIGQLQANAEIPHARLVAEMAALGINAPALPVIMHVTTPNPLIRAAGLEFSRKSSAPQMSRAVTIGFDQFSEAENCYIKFDVRLTERDEIERLRAFLVAFFDVAAADPDVPLTELTEKAGIAPVWATDLRTKSLERLAGRRR